MWSLMYFQQINKLDAIDGGADDCEHGCTYCYGMVYECCVANHMQGWCDASHQQYVMTNAAAHCHTCIGHRRRPKFLSRQWAIGQDGGEPALSLLQYFPSSIEGITVTEGATASVNISTSYPFDSEVSLSIFSTGPFSLQLRIPGWCRNATVATNGKIRPAAPAGMMQTIPITADKTAVVLTLPLVPRIE
eukprot:SAG31_NODE_18988_length_615_cov_1.284884_1_plen_189_part_10